MHQRVYSPDGISPTITAQGGGNQEKKILAEPQIKVVGEMVGGKWETSYSLSRQVYDPEGIAPTQVAAAGAGGNNETKIIVDDLYAGREKRIYKDTAPTLRGERSGLKVVAFRGRNPENPSDRRAGIHLEQRAETREDGLTNTLTTVQKDNMIMFNHYNQSKITDIAPTQTANCGSTTSSSAVLQVKTVNGKFNAEKRLADRKELSNTIRCGGRGTLTDKHAWDIVAEQDEERTIRIRKLTPTECWRLMGWQDEQIAKVKAVMSNAQMYKQAGNGIVVTVLEAIFKNLFRKE